MERPSQLRITYRLLPLFVLFQLLTPAFGDAAPAMQIEELEGVPPVMQTADPVAPPAMEFQPPVDADSLEDFLPPGIALQRTSTEYGITAETILPARRGSAFSFSDDRVAVIIEESTFDGDVSVQYQEQAVLNARRPIQGEAETAPTVEATATAVMTATLPAAVTATPPVSVTVTVEDAASIEATATAAMTTTLRVEETATPVVTASMEAPAPTVEATATVASPSDDGTATSATPPSDDETDPPAAGLAITVTNTISNPINSLDLIRFDLEVVDDDGARVARFGRQVRIVVDLRPLMVGLDTELDDFYLAYRDEADPLVWHNVPIQVHQPGGLISAEVAHFSHWAAGVRPERWNPSWTPPAVSSFSGAATYSHPLAVPPGRNGLQPSVALSYSSRALDGHIRDAEAGDVAHGWSLAQISIVRAGVKLREYYTLPQTYHPDRFRLVLNGAGHELFPESGVDTATAATVRYYARDLPGFKIYRYYNAAAPNKDGLYWLLIGPDGVRYRLGYLGNSPHNAEEWQQTSATVHLAVDGHVGRANAISAIAWYVDTVTDLHGNQMTYRYVAESNGESIDWYNSNHWTSFTLTTQTNRLDRIYYNYPDRVTTPPPAPVTVAQLTSTPATKILFRDNVPGSEVDPITSIYVYHGSDHSAPMTEYRLKVEEETVESPGCINYDKAEPEPRKTTTRMVTEIQQFAGMDGDPVSKDTGSGQTGALPASLPATTFEYQYQPHFLKNGAACFQYYYLSKVKNGYGGEVSFTYGNDGRAVGSYVYYTYDHYQWPEIGYTYYVLTQTNKDGRNPETATTYEFENPCYDQTEADVGAMTGAFKCTSPGAPRYSSIVGFGKVTQVSRGFSNELLGEQVTTFAQDVAGAMGRPLLEEFKSAAGILLHCTRSNYTTEPLGGVTTFSAPLVVDRRQYGEGEDDDCGDYNLGELVPGKVLQSVVSYVYDSYGNVIELHDHGDFSTNIDDRKTTTSYYPNTGTWIVNKPATVVLHQGIDSGTSVQETRYTYDDNPNYQTAPTQGELMKVQQGLPGAILGGGSGGFITTAEYTYDDYGNVKTTRTPHGQTTTLFYDGGYNLYPVKVTNALHHATTFDVYGFKRADGTVAPLNGFQKQPGLLRRVADANGVATAYEYDPFGRLHAVYDAEPFGGNPDGFVGFANTDPWDGDPRERYRYWDNSWNNSVTYLNPAGNAPFVTTVEQRPGSWPAPASSAAGFAYTAQTFYDGFGRPIQERTLWAGVHSHSASREIISSTAYNALGQVACQTAPYDVAAYADRTGWPASPFVTHTCTSRAHTATAYDAQGRVTSVTAPDGTVSATNYSVRNNVAASGYSRLQLVQSVDANKHVINRFTNVRGELVLVREVTGVFGGSMSGYADTRYAYDILGNLTRVRTSDSDNAEPSGWLRETTMEYDVLGRKVKMTDPDMGAWHYGYDSSGNLVSQTDALGTTLTFNYDGLERLTSRKHGSTVLAQYVYDMAANGKGKLHTVSWGPSPSANKDTFFYDARGRLYKQTRLLSGRSYTLETTDFDALDRPLTVKYPNNEVVTYTYDREGEETIKAGSQVVVDKVQYNGRGQLRVLERANGVDTTYNYFAASGAAGTGNSAFRLSNITTVKSGSAALLNLGYQYDPVGNITQITDNLLPSHKTQTFSYDHLNRLTEASTPPNAVNPYDHEYEYDTLGNITEFAGAVYDYTTWHAGCAVHGSQPAPQAVKTIGGLSGDYFCYDDNGNMSKRRQGGVTYNQSFDVENRLVSVQQVGTGTTTFEYDANGQRVKTQRPDGSVVYAPFPDYEEEVRPLPPTVTPTPTNTPTPTPTNTPTPTATPTGPPAAPANLTATYQTLGGGSVALTWSPLQAPAGATFNVYRSAQQPVPLNSAHRIASGRTIGLYVDNNGQQGDYYVVTAQNSRGESGPSNTAMASSGGGASMMSGGGEELVRRTTYHIAGQAVAVRVRVEGGNNNLLHLHNDHLGSNSVMSYNSSGNPVSGSRTRYLPFGDWRTAPTQAFTDIAYTGQRENMELGLYYYNARFYLPSIGRFASADTIVPQPGAPQSFNRYSYGLNNPVKYSDPSGHVACASIDGECMPSKAPPVFGSEHERFIITLDYMHAEMITNAESEAVSNIQILHSLVDNALQSQNPLMLGSIRDWKTGALTLWAAKVGPGLEWDHKPKLTNLLELAAENDFYFPIAGSPETEWYYDIWSNIHYGFVGAAAGFSGDTLQMGAATAELAGRTDHADVLTVQIGIDLWHEYGLDLTSHDLWAAILGQQDNFVGIQAAYPEELWRVDQVRNNR